MNAIILQLWVLTIAGWINRSQQQVIEYLMEENRVLREQLGRRRLRLTDAQRRRLAVRDRVSQVPGGPSRSCPALRPRWNRHALTLEDNLVQGSCCLLAAFTSCQCLNPVQVAVSPPRGTTMLPSATSTAAQHSTAQCGSSELRTTCGRTLRATRATARLSPA
jgi:hypothetical protein